MRFIGKVAVVTGSGDGLGLVVARSLFKEGAKVAVVDKNGESARKAAEENR